MAVGCRPHAALAATLDYHPLQHWRHLAGLLPSRSFVVLVGQIQVSLCSLPRQHHHANDAARAAVPLDGLGQRSLDKSDALLLIHALAPVGIAVSVNVRRARAADGIRLLVQRASGGNRVDLAAMTVVPSRNDQASAAGRLAGVECEPWRAHSRQLVLVGIAQFLE